MKNKNGMKWLKKISIIGASIVGFGIILGSFVKISVYIEAPQNIKANAEDIYDIKQYINEQRIANELQQKWQEQQVYYPRQVASPNQGYQQPYSEEPKYEEPPRRCWNIWTDGYEYEVDCRSGEWM